MAEICGASLPTISPAESILANREKIMSGIKKDFIDDQTDCSQPPYN
jgi:hypothetical protein